MTVYLYYVESNKRAYTMMAKNHDGHKVYHDGHSNENVKNWWSRFHFTISCTPSVMAYNKSPNSRHRWTNFSKLCLWSSLSVAVMVVAIMAVAVMVVAVMVVAVMVVAVMVIVYGRHCRTPNKQSVTATFCNQERWITNKLFGRKFQRLAAFVHAIYASHC